MRIGYCRVSTKSAEQTASIEVQAKRLADYGCDRVLVDHGISGFREGGRKGSTFPELIDLILDRTATEVIVPNFDRTQRRAKWGSQLLDALETTGCRLLELDTGTWLDPANNPTDVLMAQIRSAVQENESRVRRLKVRKALAERRAEGKYASGKVPFGYAHIDGAVVPHPEEWEAARLWWEQLREVEFNLAGWLKQYGAEITPRGIKAWIVNSTLRGVVNNRPGMTCKPLITEVEWEEAERYLAARSLARGVGLDRQIHLFTGLVKCDACGKSLHNVRDRAVARLKCKSRHCSRYGRGIAVGEVKRRTLQTLQERVDAMAVIADVSDWEDPVVAALEDEIRRLEDTGMAAVQPLIDERRQQLNARLSRRSSSRLDELRAVFADPAALAGASDRQLRPVLLEFIERIVWLGGLDGDSAIAVTLR
jgi:DNA invertase Pin-like site-specific DNA recombinase